MTSQEEIKNMLRPEWIRLPAKKCNYTGLSRSTIGRLINDKKVRTRLVKTNPTNVKGMRYFHLPSLEQWMKENSVETSAN